MSVPNGSSTLSTLSETGTGNGALPGEKRKRTQDEDNEMKMKGHETLKDDEEDDEGRSNDFREFLNDLLEVLQVHDTTPSILQLPLTSGADDQPASKRVRLSTPPSNASLASQIKSGSYRNIDEFLADVEHAATLFAGAKPEPSDSARSRPNKIPPRSLQIASFKHDLGFLIRLGLAQNPKSIKRSLQDRGSITKDLTNSHESKNTQTIRQVGSASKVALTLLGSVPQPKQLFSSLQQPTKLSLLKEDLGTSEVNIRHAPALISIPLRETALPNGITTTRIIPVHSEDLSNNKTKRASFGSSFGPPPNVPPLNPPKQSKHVATRSQSVSWYSPADKAPPSRPRGRDKETYTNQALSTGHWLTYNVVPSSAQLSSPVEKRKQLDRALSGGELASVPDEIVAEHQRVKADALFKSAYSSFAPDYDNSAALVPQQLGNRLWWSRVGEKRYQMMGAIASFGNPEASSDIRNGYPVLNEANEDDLFREAVESFESEDVSAEFDIPNIKKAGENPSEEDIDEILHEISGLLETLNSYQRIRNLSSTANSRSTGSQNSQVAGMYGSPTSPSTAEFDLYEILKSQLVVMISALPPYAVAKLNGDQLGALNMSTKIQATGKLHKGTMEENDFALKARQPLMNPISNPAVRTGTPQMGGANRPTHYQSTATPAQHPAYSSSTRPPAASATYSSRQYSGRPATSQYSSYGAQPPQSTSRQSYSAHQYGPQTPQAHGSQYSNNHRQYSLQNGYSTYGQQYATPSSTASPTPLGGTQLQRPSQPGYQQRAMNSQAYGYPPSARSSSPQNRPAYTPQQQPRSQYYAPSTSHNPSRPQYNPNNGSITATNASAVERNGNVGTIGEHIRLTAEEQATIMRRQKDMLTAKHHPDSASMQQPTNGVVDGARSNGNTTPQPNGITAGQHS